MPAAFNGVWSIKPSANRLPLLNTANSSPGQINIPTVVGIIGSSAESLKYLFESLLSTKPWNYDPNVLPLPWRQPEDVNGVLVFGLMEFDGIVKPHPPIARALRIVAQALKDKGHKVC
jgi:amidase